MGIHPSHPSSDKSQILFLPIPQYALSLSRSSYPLIVPPLIFIPLPFNISSALLPSPFLSGTRSCFIQPRPSHSKNPTHSFPLIRQLFLSKSFPFLLNSPLSIYRFLPPNNTHPTSHSLSATFLPLHIFPLPRSFLTLPRPFPYKLSAPSSDPPPQLPPHPSPLLPFHIPQKHAAVVLIPLLPPPK